MSNLNDDRYLTLIYYVLKCAYLFIFLAIENEAAKEAFQYRIIMFVDSWD